MTAISVTGLAPAVGALVEGVEVTRPVAPAVFAEIRAAFEEHSVLVFHGQPLDDDAQMVFSKNFGPLEVTRSVNPAAGTPFARQSNLDIRTGEVIPPDDRRMIYQRADMLWHSDSSFKRVPALCSLLSARIGPPEGGATEFTSTRAAYAALPEATRAAMEDLTVIHDFSWSRDQISPGFFTAEERAPYPPVRHRLVRTNPVNGRRSMLIGAHASSIEGMTLEAGRAFLKELLEHAGRPEFRYRHEWREGDLVVWDNRAVLHRATPYDTVRYRRLMQRTTVSGDGREETLACAS